MSSGGGVPFPFPFLFPLRGWGVSDMLDFSPADGYQFILIQISGFGIVMFNYV
jgi:hypothetical protein